MSEHAEGEGTRGQTPEDVQRLPSVPPHVFEAGETVPGLSSWVLDRKLGGGGFGEVWLARHALDAEQRPRAVKFCTDPAARHRLVTHEKNVVARVMKYAPKHPNIVPLLDYNLDGDTPWLMYEFVDGGTLAHLIRAWQTLPLPNRLGDVISALHAVAGALAACHRLDPPLVHRDMKPQNVLIAGSVPRVTDFGIGGVAMPVTTDGATGALTAYAARLPSALQAAGTGRYAPPEQLLGSPPNPRDDVYALGVIAYQMLKGNLTTAPGTDASLELRDLGVPAELVSLIVCSVALDPDRRPQDAAEWETALAALIVKSGVRLSAASGSEPVLLPEPTGHRTPRTEPPLFLHPLSTDLPPEPLPLAEPMDGAPARTPPRTGLFAALVCGLILVLSLLAGAVYLFLAGKEAEPTQPSAKGDPKDDPKGEKPHPKNSPLVPKPGEICDVEIAARVSMTFCWIPAGECQLGSPKSEQDYLTKTCFGGKRPSLLDEETEERGGRFKTPGFWMGKYEVTQAEWTAVMGSNPSFFDGKEENKAKGIETARFPVERVSWDMICGKDGFLDRVNAHGGIQKVFGKGGAFKLPHEDAWEYACRGGLGNARPFYFGDKLNGTEANCGGDNPYGTAAKGQYLGRTCPVDFTNGGYYEKHPWGLMHMHGNVLEWCDNVYEKTSRRVLRGGSWGVSAEGARSARRFKDSPEISIDPNAGCRLCLRLD